MVEFGYRFYLIKGLYKWLKKFKGEKEQKLIVVVVYGVVIFYIWINRFRIFYGEEDWGIDQIVYRIRVEIGYQMD